MEHIRRQWLGRKDQRVAPAGTIVVAGLRDQQTKLHAAMQAAEIGFGSLGRQMEDMSRIADAIASLATQVLEVSSGTDEKSALYQAANTFKMAFGRIESRQSHYLRILHRLRDLGDRATRVLTTRDELTRALFPFKPLVMGFRVEAARLRSIEATRFLDLAEAIAGAHTMVLNSIDRHFDALADLLEFIQSIAVRLGGHSSNVEQALARTRNSLDEHLSLMKQRWSRAVEIGAAADGAVRDISKQIGRIIVATQYQDISRQQIGHVSDAIDAMATLLDALGLDEFTEMHSAAQERLNELRQGYTMERERDVHDLASGMPADTGQHRTRPAVAEPGDAGSAETIADASTSVSPSDCAVAEAAAAVADPVESLGENVELF